MVTCFSKHKENLGQTLLYLIFFPPELCMSEMKNCLNLASSTLIARVNHDAFSDEEYFQTLEPPQYVYWYHNDKIINYDTKRTRVSFDLGELLFITTLACKVQTPCFTGKC